MWYATMSLVDRLKGALGGAEEEQYFDYHCRECDSEFESREKSRSNVACPECGASGARAITKL